MKIVLLGYMGSGKTTIGMKLAENLDADFLDLDRYIEEAEGISIAEVFQSKGEIYFRKKEHDYLKKIVTNKNGFVLSTGGGTPCYGENMDVILSATKNVFYLKNSKGQLLNRLLSEKEHRPLIKKIDNSDLPEFIAKHLFERSFFYERAHHTILCDDKYRLQSVPKLEIC